MNQTTKTIFTFIVSVVCALASVQAGQLPKTAKLLPPETLLLMDIEDFSKLEQQFEKTSFYKLYKDPAMAAFIKDAKAKWQEKILKPDEKNIFKTIIDADILPRTKAAFALVLNEKAKDANEPMALFITQWGQNTAKIKEAVEKAVKKALEEGLHKKTEDYHSVNITTLIGEDSTRLGFGFSSRLSFCFVDDCLLGSEDIELLKFAIAHIKGVTGPTLADDSDYIAAAAATGPYHDIDLYVNIKQAVKAAIADDPTGQTQRTITNLGLDNVVALSVSIGVAPSSESAWTGKAFLKINGPKKGICKMLEVQSAAINVPSFVPASARSVTFVNLNIEKAYDELGSVLNLFSPQAAAIMYMPLLPDSPDGQPGVQIKRDIISHLGSEILVAQSINKPFSDAGPAGPTESFVALSTSNRSALEKSLSLLHSKLIAPNNPDARRQFLGHTLYLIDLLGFMPAFSPRGTIPMQTSIPDWKSTIDNTSMPQAPKMAFTVTDTHLIFGTESTVERAIRSLSGNDVPTVGSEKWFTRAKSAIPSVVGVAGFEDNVSSGELLWWTLKQSEKSGLSAIQKGPVTFRFGASEIGEFADCSLLPEFDAVRKYFGWYAFYGLSRPDGFFFESKHINSN